jgi:hypothetical protein
MRKSEVTAITIIVCVFILAVAAMFLFGCTPPAVVEAPNVHVVNSAWEIVREETLARAIESTDELQEEIDAYNSANTDDQWRLIYGDVPGIEDAPTADAFIVFADTHEISSQYIGIERKDLLDRRTTWRLQVELDSSSTGRPCVLYVDNVPPAPVVVVPEPVDPYVAYAIYVLDSSGAVLWEEHPAAGEYAGRLYAWRLSVEVQNAGSPDDPWTLITGRLWP